MSARPSEEFGVRLARYRRLAGLSAQQLSDALGGEISRGVIANIESGRKSDVTVDQLLALAWVLDVPPVVLALPVETPHKLVAVTDSTEPTSVVRSHAALHWFNGDTNSSFRSGTPGAGAALSRSMLKAITEWEQATRRLQLTKQRSDEGTVDRDRLEEDERDLERAEEALRQLGADLTVFTFDD